MLDIDMKFKKGILIARLKGVLNKETTFILEKDLNRTVKTNGIKYVLLNLNQLSYIDEYGIKAIHNSYNEIVSNKGKLIVCGIDKILKDNYLLTDSLYQVNDEVSAYNIVNI